MPEASCVSVCVYRYVHIHLSWHNFYLPSILYLVFYFGNFSRMEKEIQSFVAYPELDKMGSTNDQARFVSYIDYGVSN